jgi:hypothetical protein
MAEVAEPIEEPTYEEPAAEEPEVEEEEEFVAVGGATEVKLFGKWSFDDIEIRDISLEVRPCKHRIEFESLGMMRTGLLVHYLFMNLFVLMVLVSVSLQQYFLTPSISSTTHRITLPARETMPLTFPTLPDATKRSVSARHRAPSSSVLYAA